MEITIAYNNSQQNEIKKIVKFRNINLIRSHISACISACNYICNPLGVSIYHTEGVASKGHFTRIHLLLCGSAMEHNNRLYGIWTEALPALITKRRG